MKNDNNVLPIEVFRRRFDELMVDYFWLLVLLSLVTFLYQYDGKPAVILLSFYPVFFLVGALLRSFLKNKIIQTFQHLFHTGALAENLLEKFVVDFQRQLNHRLGDILGIVIGLWIVWYYYYALLQLFKDPFTYALSFPVIVIDVLLGYIVGLAIWKAFITSLEIRRLGLRGHLILRPFHPDQCAGLAVIGKLLFSLSFVYVVIGLFLSGWLIYGWINPGFNHFFPDLEPWFIGGLVMLIIVSSLAFVWPMMSVHRLMKDKASFYEARLVPLARKISELEESLLPQESEIDNEQLQNDYDKIQSLRSIYSQQQKIPTWPVDFHTRVEFFGVQLALYVGILSNMEKFYNLITNIFT